MFAKYFNSKFCKFEFTILFSHYFTGECPMLD